MTKQLTGTTLETYSSNSLEIGGVLETDEGLEEIWGVWETARLLSARNQSRWRIAERQRAYRERSR